MFFSEDSYRKIAYYAFDRRYDYNCLKTRIKRKDKEINELKHHNKLLKDKYRNKSYYYCFR